MSITIHEYAQEKMAFAIALARLDGADHIYIQYDRNKDIEEVLAPISNKTVNGYCHGCSIDPETYEISFTQTPPEMIDDKYDIVFIKNIDTSDIEEQIDEMRSIIENNNGLKLAMRSEYTIPIEVCLVAGDPIDGVWRHSEVHDTMMGISPEYNLIEKHIENKTHLEVPLPIKTWQELNLKDGNNYHNARIAHLVISKNRDPIDISLDESFGKAPRVVDGYHRIAATLHRNEKDINVRSDAETMKTLYMAYLKEIGCQSDGDLLNTISEITQKPINKFNVNNRTIPGIIHEGVFFSYLGVKVLTDEYISSVDFQHVSDDGLEGKVEDVSDEVKDIISVIYKEAMKEKNLKSQFMTVHENVEKSMRMLPNKIACFCVLPEIKNTDIIGSHIDFTCDLDVAIELLESKNRHSRSFKIYEVPFGAFKHEHKLFHETNIADSVPVPEESDNGLNFPFAQEDGTFSYSGNIESHFFGEVRLEDRYLYKANKPCVIPLIPYNNYTAYNNYRIETALAVSNHLKIDHIVAIMVEGKGEYDYKQLMVKKDDNTFISSYGEVSVRFMEEHTFHVYGPNAYLISVEKSDLYETGYNDSMVKAIEDKLSNEKEKNITLKCTLNM